MMTGLDHTRADLSIRERFAVSKEKTLETVQTIVDSGIVSASVIISTCNRTELYASVPLESEPILSRILCEALERNYSEYEGYFMDKSEDQALEHLCRVASGLDSQIIGDDQIITQAREAIELSRELGCTDSYVEKMFNQAIAAAKAIKTKVILRTLGVDSVPAAAVDTLLSMMPLLGKKALVIGNGQMGRLVAQLLVAQGASVTMTLRQYKKGEIVVPDGADTVLYSERYPIIEKADIVVSATSSPHYTIYREELDKLDRLPTIFIDIAVPRDIEPSIDNLDETKVLTVDNIASKSRELPKESQELIDEIIKEHTEKYNDWHKYKTSVGALGMRS
ncbi:MAG: glutamyl-tRNA reductase [Oscillospiraceae bacterium]|nr:glutamyl-tRNA reductase [Oscillospiraceae bacterium]